MSILHKLTANNNLKEHWSGATDGAVQDPDMVYSANFGVSSF